MADRSVDLSIEVHIKTPVVTEAARIKPTFMAEWLAASSGEEVCRLLAKAHQIVLDASEHSVM